MAYVAHLQQAVHGICCALATGSAWHMLRVGMQVLNYALERSAARLPEAEERIDKVRSTAGAQCAGQ